MIHIIEKSPIKISGVTSLFVTFDFNVEIVNIIKQAEKYVYNKNTHEWELPISCLAYLLDNLTYLDDITLQLKQEDKNKTIFKPILTYKTKPFKHQMEAINWGLNHDSWLCLYSPGLGKSLSAIDLALELQAQKDVQHCLIICGVNTLKSNWRKEIQTHSDASYRVIGEKINSKGKVTYATMKERATELKAKNDAFFYIINIESLRSDEIVDAIKNSVNKIDMIVLDECHRAGNPSAIQAKNLLKLTNYRYKIGLTGTLLTNSPLNAYVPLKWIGAEHATLTNFKSQYCEFGGFGGHQIVGYKNIDILKEVIDTCALRRTVNDLDVELPPKTIIKESVALNDADRQFYDAIKKGVKESCDKIELDNKNVMSLTLRLRQATACPSYLSTENIESSKLNRAVELVEDVIGRGEKIVIMCTFKESVYKLAEMLKQYKPLVNTGDIEQGIIDKNIDQFQTDSKCKVFIGTYAKMSTGITLNAASYMICIDQAWTYAMNEQAQDRIYRINNTKPAFIYYLICENTVDEVVDRIVSRKKAIGDYIVDDAADEDTIAVLRDYIQDL